MAIVYKDVNHAEKILKEIRSKWAEFVLRYEEQIYFNHGSEIEREVGWVAFRGFKYCPMCCLPLANHWMFHKCEEKTFE